VRRGDLGAWAFSGGRDAHEYITYFWDSTVGGVNLYVYTVSDPLDFIDLEGEGLKRDIGAIFLRILEFFSSSGDPVEAEKLEGRRIDRQLEERKNTERLEERKPQQKQLPKGPKRAKGFADLLTLSRLGTLPLLLSPTDLACSEIDCDNDGVPDYLQDGDSIVFGEPRSESIDRRICF